MRYQNHCELFVREGFQLPRLRMSWPMGKDIYSVAAGGVSGLRSVSVSSDARQIRHLSARSGHGVGEERRGLALDDVATASCSASPKKTAVTAPSERSSSSRGRSGPSVRGTWGKRLLPKTWLARLVEIKADTAETHQSHRASSFISIKTGPEQNSRKALRWAPWPSGRW